MGRRMRLLLVASLVASVLAVPAAAQAHGDDGLAIGHFELAPGESVSFDGELHYHRLAARVSADGPVTLRLLDPDGVAAITAGPGEELAVNELIACCDQAWTAYTLVLENVGQRPVVADATARLVHDDLAVMVYGAESGTEASLVVFAIIWVAVLWRVVRRWGSGQPARRPVVTLVVLVSVVVLLAVVGATRYGAGGAPALLAALGDLPLLPDNPIVSEASLMLGVAIIGWGVAGARWAKWRPHVERARWATLGVAVLGAPVVVALVVGSAYGAVAIPAASALVAAVPPLVVLALGMRPVPQHEPEAPAAV